MLLWLYPRPFEVSPLRKFNVAFLFNSIKCCLIVLMMLNVLYRMLLALPAENKEGDLAYFNHYYVEVSNLYGVLKSIFYLFDLDTFHGIWEHVEPWCIFFPEICHSSKRP